MPEPLTPQTAKALKKSDEIVVITTGQTWLVNHVELRGVLPFVHIQRESSSSVITPERLHLFSLIDNKKVQDAVVEPISTQGIDFEILRNNLTEALIETKEAATVDLTVEEAKHIAKRIEDYVTEEPDLSKPARKPRKKKE